MSGRPFSGSYNLSDLHCLLVPGEFAETGVAEKEDRIQLGARHYSEMLGPASVPDSQYLEPFEDELARNRRRLALDILRLAGLIAGKHAGAVTLVSLNRAGTPVGALLARVLRSRWRRQVSHYSISVVIGRGVDARALDWIRAQAGHLDERVVFVAGWTAKGVIQRELRRAITQYNDQRDARLDATFHVVCDLCGATAAASSVEDYLVPSALLGALVSGLVSRSVLDENALRGVTFHGCRYYEELAPHDQTNRFLDEVALEQFDRDEPMPGTLLSRDMEQEQANSRKRLDATLSLLEVDSDSLVKPGIAEATRVLLCRVPRTVAVRSRQDEDVAHILHLSRLKGVTVRIEPELGWRPVATLGAA